MLIKSMKAWPDHYAILNSHDKLVELPKGLKRIVKLAWRARISLILGETPERIELRWIDRGRFFHGGAPKGSPVPIILALCAYADRHQRSIWLEVIDGPKLVKYYEQFGFEILDNFETGEDFTMIRFAKRAVDARRTGSA